MLKDWLLGYLAINFNCFLKVDKKLFPPPPLWVATIPFLFENASLFIPGNEGMAAVYINEHQYQAQLSLDKEINIMSLISRLIELK